MLLPRRIMANPVMGESGADQVPRAGHVAPAAEWTHSMSLWSEKFADVCDRCGWREFGDDVRLRNRPARTHLGRLPARSRCWSLLVRV
jgi:hypothetical protein